MIPRLLRLILLVVSFYFTTAAVRAQSIPFGDAFLPTFSFTESYLDTVVLGDFGYEQVPDGALTINGRFSMKNVVVEDMLAEDNALILTAGNLDLSLSLADAEQSEASGYKVFTWSLTDVDLSTGADVVVGTVVMKFNASELKLNVTVNDAPGAYSVFATQAAGTDDVLENSPVFLTFGVGPYTLEEVLLYVSGTASTFDKTVGTGDEAQTFYGLAKVNLTGKIDSTLPSVSLTYPKPQFGRIVYTVTDRPVNASGTCGDNYGVASVEVQVNDGPFRLATISAGTWSLADLEMIVGKNTIRVRCTDQDGHVKTIATSSNFSLLSDLTVKAAGNAPGRVTSEFFAPLAYDPAATSPTITTKQKDGAPLIITAIPGPNAVFDGWTANKPLTAQQLASPQLSFKHQPNLTLTANFLINPFAPVRGRYNGLASSTAPAGVGFFSTTLAPNGTFTGSAKIGAVILKLKGKFSNTGRYTKTVKIGGVEYTIDLTLNVTGTGTEQITGTIRGGTVDVSISAPRSTFDKLKNPAPQAGTYNVIIPPGAGQPDTFPTGIGFGRVTVSPAGSARFTGRSGTSPTFNAAAQLSTSGTWPFFGALYGKRGSISGVIAFDLTNPAHDLTGTLTWFKPNDVPLIPVYVDGFTGQSTLFGAKFLPAAVGQRLFLDASSGRGKISFNAPADSTLAALQATLDATLGTDNRLTTTASPGDPLQTVQATANPLTGLFFGSFMEGAVLTRFSGAIVNTKLNQAGGFFRRGTHTGAVQITPPE